MKSIRINNEAYEFLVYMAQTNKRTLVSTLDLFIEIFKEGNDARVEGKSLQESKKRKVETR